VAIVHRVALSVRRGLTFRSCNIASRQGTVGMRREAGESDQVDDDQRQRPTAVCQGAENR
jgi:hypothetical protein